MNEEALAIAVELAIVKVGVGLVVFLAELKLQSSASIETRAAMMLLAKRTGSIAEVQLLNVQGEDLPSGLWESSHVPTSRTPLPPFLGEGKLLLSSGCDATLHRRPLVAGDS